MSQCAYVTLVTYIRINLKFSRRAILIAGCMVLHRHEAAGSGLLRSDDLPKKRVDLMESGELHSNVSVINVVTLRLEENNRVLGSINAS